MTIHVPQAIHPTFKDASFDLTLDRLLERKRGLSHAMLRPPVEVSDVEALFGGMMQPGAGPANMVESTNTASGLTSADERF